MGCSISHASLGSQCRLHIVRGVLIALRANAECEYFVPDARRPALGKKHMSRPMRSLLVSFSFFGLPLCFGMLGALLAACAHFVRFFGLSMLSSYCRRVLIALHCVCIQSANIPCVTSASLLQERKK